MGKIYILGNKESIKKWASLHGQLIEVPESMTEENIHDFVCEHFSTLSADDKLIIDLDSTLSPPIALTIALHVRLSVVRIQMASLLPILFVSYFPLQTYTSAETDGSQIFLSKAGWSFCAPIQVFTNINAIQPLSVAQYKTDFLDRIQIHPDAQIGRHSIANQWGAEVFSRVMGDNNGVGPSNLSKVKKMLYFKYIYLNTSNIQDLIGGNRLKKVSKNIKNIESRGKNILLIDDMADKGWAAILRRFFKNCRHFDVVNDRISSVEKMCKEIQDHIHGDYYDLYLLDLRMLDTAEDDIFNPDDFSGMKILKEIKEINPGNQVIMMTASNKAWNLKKLMDEGADGYYIKESPEYKLPITFSKANIESFQNDAKASFANIYKRKLYRKVETLKKLISDSKMISKDFSNELKITIDTAYYQLTKARKDNEFAYAYVTLFQTLEQIIHYYFDDGDLDKKDVLPKEGSTMVGIQNYLRYIKIGNNQVDADFKAIDNQLHSCIRKRNDYVHQNPKAQSLDYEDFKDLLDTLTSYLECILKIA